jgi:phage-related tail protein
MNDLKSIFHFAKGVTNFQGGLAIVGEEGPELVQLPQGSSVIPAPQTASMLSGSQGAPSVSNNTTSTRSVVIQSVNIYTAPAAEQFVRSLDQDTLLVSGGMTPNRGRH